MPAIPALPATLELAAPVFGGESYISDGAPGPMRKAVFTRLEVVDRVIVEYDGTPWRVVFLNVDNATGEVDVWFRQVTKAGHVDYKRDNSFLFTSLDQHLRDRLPGLVDLIEAALAPMRAEADREALDRMVAKFDARQAEAGCGDPGCDCKVEDIQPAQDVLGALQDTLRVITGEEPVATDGPEAIAPLAAEVTDAVEALRARLQLAQELQDELDNGVEHGYYRTEVVDQLAALRARLHATAVAETCPDCREPHGAHVPGCASGVVDYSACDAAEAHVGEGHVPGDCGWLNAPAACPKCGVSGGHETDCPTQLEIDEALLEMSAHADCRRNPCPYCREIQIADDGPETDDTYLEDNER